MSAAFEELAYEKSALGELILRRRRFPALGELDVFEVILNDEFLMSSLFTAGEIALAELGLEALAGKELDILVGGLGLGYTADAVLASPRVRSLAVIEALGPVIDWHERGILPLSTRLNDDPRSAFVKGDFFALAADSFRALEPRQKFDGVFLDIDHSPADLLKPSNGDFYSVAGLTNLRASLHAHGVFALWSNDSPEQGFMAALAEVFEFVDAEIVPVENPLNGITAYNTIYRGRC